MLTISQAIAQSALFTYTLERCSEHFCPLFVIITSATLTNALKQFASALFVRRARANISCAPLAAVVAFLCLLHLEGMQLAFGQAARRARSSPLIKRRNWR